MNELQLALIGLGVLAVAGVWAYNLWQARQHRKAVEKGFVQTHDDVLMKDAPPARVAEAAAPPRREPTVAADEAETYAVVTPTADAPAVEARSVPPVPAEWADEIADYTLRIEFVEAVAAPELWALQAPWAEQLQKTVTWAGFDERSDAWRRLDAHDAGRYTHVAVSLQLADRRGAASEATLGSFLDGAHKLAQRYSGLIELPERQALVKHALALDEFCAGVDIQLGIHVIDAAAGAFVGTKLRGLAEAAGLRLRDDGLFHAVGDDGETLFALGNAGPEMFTVEGLRTLATPGVTLTLDVPRAVDGQAVFDRMLATARQLAHGLGGLLVDAQRRPFDDVMIGGIRAKIGELQQTMAANRIAPGSPRALRLFS